MIIRFYQVGCADAAQLQYKGDDGKMHHIFIDSGLAGSYRNVLRQEIKRISDAAETIDLWVITHQDSDHIGGVDTYIKAILKGDMTDIVQKWWFNPPKISKTALSAAIVSTHAPISDPHSLQQAADVTNYLLDKGELWQNNITNQTQKQNFNGLEMVLLSPNEAKLKALRKAYKNDTLKRDIKENISLPMSSASNDYDTKIAAFDLDAITEDTAVENGSSIAFITDYQCKTVLWLADAHPTVLVTSLKAFGYTVEKPLICDWVKVAHHGSKSNNSKELYSLICCNNYLISANGENRDKLPNKATFAQILRNKHRFEGATYHFVFTHDNSTLRSIFTEEEKKIFNFKVTYSKESNYAVEL